MEYGYTAIKGNKLLKCSTTWVSYQESMLVEKANPIKAAGSGRTVAAVRKSGFCPEPN